MSSPAHCGRLHDSRLCRGAVCHTDSLRPRFLTVTQVVTTVAARTVIRVVRSAACVMAMCVTAFGVLRGSFATSSIFCHACVTVIRDSWRCSLAGCTRCYSGDCVRSCGRSCRRRSCRRCGCSRCTGRIGSSIGNSGTGIGRRGMSAGCLPVLPAFLALGALLLVHHRSGGVRLLNKGSITALLAFLAIFLRFAHGTHLHARVAQLLGEGGIKVQGWGHTNLLGAHARRRARR